MFWNEENDEQQEFVIPDNVVDVVFAVKDCPCLPAEHAYPLAEALQQTLPWLAEEEQVGVHPIYGAESGNGWQRPADPDAPIYLSRRQKMTLRVPRERVEDARQLSGSTLEVDGYSLTVGEAKTRLLSDLPTLFARNVATRPGLSEDEFLEQVARELQELDVQVKKMMASIERDIRTPDGPLHTRGLMLADLTPEDSVRLQETGLGPHRKLGCGLFVPQKGIKAV
ncbi:type I-MYXAN CRISPR-associated protein Cas6/Cmx6 [Thiohalophilus thiocyanatoxydans]|uniref:CRISPR-associated protein Cas6 n=1 Tax=Thiohalophilus thiocyanatoxydans TaxID=381308 RepID=A0A4R8IPB0_9GAMM|nr:type I-MYXAN CRISPR-associated protein Cas6/Cmx6 [Thiohalophilus thiocyanatoxydans]TDY02746.1 CRISPR-associated protein Cas6 [Thiohalophilus thiocyanatoxydans]